MPTLYVVATPLGHLGDLTPRAAETLRTVAVVAAEDTRRTRALLTHLDVRPRLLSFHAHSDTRRRDLLVELLREGRDIALVTDAGTPGISDPGAALVDHVRAAGFPVVPIPGPSAVVTALSAAGLPADRFLFLGFLPRKGGERTRLLRQAADSEWTVVLFEAPARLPQLLRDLAEVAGGERRAVVGRELTKIHEEFRAGSLTELAGHWTETEPRGEFTVLLAGREAVSPEQDTPSGETRTLAARLLSEGRSRKDVVHLVAEQTGLSRNAAYRLVMELS